MHRMIWLSVLVPFVGIAGAHARAAEARGEVTADTLIEAEKLLGISFSDEEREMMLPGLQDRVKRYEGVRSVELSNSVPPALVFDPVPAGATFETPRKEPRWTFPGNVALPENAEDLAFYSVGELAELIRTRQIGSEDLTRFYLDRLKKYGPKLECVVTLTEELALEQARRADREIAAGNYRGPLHGIPYGAKDLLATKNIRTTWGSPPYEEQVFDEDATVIQRLEEAGAVLVAKLALGELAWGHTWFGGQTRNPWNYEQGSSGSSAGPAAATAAGLVAFSIGSETRGSIVSPSSRCGVTGLRPTFGRVSRAGAMTLSWSMDKIGPICRTVEDCALVFDAIRGPDGIDPTLRDLPFNYDPEIDWTELRVGYLERDFEGSTFNKENDLATLEQLRQMGANLVPIELPAYPVSDLSFILSTEAAAAFDELTRSGRDNLMVRQVRNAWPNVFRQARFVPAVEYLRANRVRWLLVQEMAELMAEVDLYLAPSLEGNESLLTNLTGHPCVVVPNGFSEEGEPRSIVFVGRLFDEATILAVAKAYQDATRFHRERPVLRAGEK